MKLCVFFIGMVALVFTNCSTLKVAPMDPKTGKLPTKIKLKREEILVDQSFPFMIITNSYMSTLPNTRGMQQAMRII